MNGDPAHMPDAGSLPCGCVWWGGMHTYVFMQRWFPYCHVPSSLSPEEEGREFSGNAPLSPVLRGGRGSWELLLATCRSAGSFLSYRERDSTSVSRRGRGGGGGAGAASPAGGHAPVASDCSVEVAQGFLFQELITYRLPAPHFISTNPTGLFKPTLLWHRWFILHIWAKT